MDRIPLTWMQKRCLKTYVHPDKYFPFYRISHIMKNKGILQRPLPTSFVALMSAIDQEGNIAFAIF